MSFYRLKDTATGKFWKGGKKWTNQGKVYSTKTNLLLAIMNKGYTFIPRRYEELNNRPQRYIVIEIDDLLVKEYSIDTLMKEYIDDKMRKALSGKIKSPSGYIYCQKCGKITNDWRIINGKVLCRECVKRGF